MCMLTFNLNELHQTLFPVDTLENWFSLVAVNPFQKPSQGSTETTSKTTVSMCMLVSFIRIS